MSRWCKIDRKPTDHVMIREGWVYPVCNTKACKEALIDYLNDMEEEESFMEVRVQRW